MLIFQVVGPFAEDGDMFGDYAATPDKKFITTPLDGLKRLAGTTQYAAGCDDAHCKNYDADSVRTAVTGAEYIFVCLGTGEWTEKLWLLCKYYFVIGIVFQVTH